MKKEEISSYLFIALGSAIYAVATVAFIFPHLLVIGGTTGISIILNKYSSLSPGMISVIINLGLLVVAFAALGKNMAVKTFIGSTLTTIFIGAFEKMINSDFIFISNPFFSACGGAAMIAIASGILFYVNSSSGGTDIIALIVKKYSFKCKYRKSSFNNGYFNCSFWRVFVWIHSPFQFFFWIFNQNIRYRFCNKIY